MVKQSDPNQASGSSPTGPDFLVENHGSIFLIQPLTPAANSWIEDHLSEDRQFFCGAVVVEHRYITDIVRGAISDGLTVQSAKTAFDLRTGC